MSQKSGDLILFCLFPEKKFVSADFIRQVALYTVNSQVNTLLIEPFKDEAYLFYIRTQYVPRCKHSISVIKTNLLMFYKAKVAVCSEIRTKHINAMWAPRRIF
jgi:hypothetical protein